MSNANIISQLTEAIQELSREVKQTCQNNNHEEITKLKEYQENSTLLEITLVTSGIIKGRILWIDDQSLGIKADSEQDFILYKHSIAFIQAKKEA